MAQENLILNVEIEGANKSTNQLVELQAQINILAENKKLINKQLKELDENFKKNAISADEYDRQLTELTEQQVENNIVLKETNKEYRTLEKTTIESAKATDVAETTTNVIISKKRTLSIFMFINAGIMERINNNFLFRRKITNLNSISSSGLES